MSESIYDREARLQLERIQMLVRLRSQEKISKKARDDYEEGFITWRRNHSRLQRERRELQKEIERNKSKAKQLDYRIRKRTKDNPGKALDMMIDNME